MNEDDIITMHDDLKVVRLEKGKLEEKKAETRGMHEKLGIPEARELIKDKLRQKGLTAERAEAVSEGEGIQIALVNSGLDVDHPDIKSTLVGGNGENCVDWVCVGTRENPKHIPEYEHDSTDVYSSQAHCLSIAGIIASKKFGIVKRARLHIAKVCDENGHGTHESVLRGLDYVCKNSGAIDLVNLSLGLSYDPDSTEELFYLCEKLRENVILVAAAGNEKYGPCIPSSSMHVLCVGATHKTEKDPDYFTVCDFSNVWPTVDIVAPGENLLGLDVKDPDEETYEDAYGLISGTSAATPVACSILGMAIAYIKERNRLAGIQEGICASDLERRLKKTACLDKIRLFDFDVDAGQIERIFGDFYGFHLINPNLKANDFIRFAAGTGRVDAAEFIKSVLREYN